MVPLAMALPTSRQEQEECGCFHKKIFSPHPRETICSERCYLLSCKNVLVSAREKHRGMKQTEDKHFFRVRAARPCLGSLWGGHPTPWPPLQGPNAGHALLAHMPRFCFLRVKRCFPLVFLPLTLKNRARCSDLGAQQGGNSVENKPTAIRSTCAALGLPSSPKTPCTSPAEEEVKNHLSHDGICINHRRWKVFGSIITHCSPTDAGSAKFTR